MRALLYLSAVLLLTAYGQLIVKARAGVNHSNIGWYGYLFNMFTDPFVLSGLFAAILASAVWMLLIAKVQLVYAYPFMALTFVLVPLGSAYFFGERVAPLQLAGLILIVAGVSLSAMTR